MRKYQIFILLMAMFMLAGCAGKDFVTNAHDILGVSKTTYDSQLNIAGDLYRQGYITEDQKNKAIEHGTTYMLVHNEATAALLEYRINENEDAKQKYLDTISDVLSRLSFLIDYVKGIKGE